jgi:S-adenosylmethionine uptake transporter
MKKENSIGTVFIILSAIFYASYGVWTKLMGDFFSGYTASAIRSLLVVMILLPLALFRNEIGSWDINKNWKKLTSMVVISTLIWGLLYYSVLFAGVGVSSTVNYAAIVIGMVLFGWLLGAENLTLEKMISVIIGSVGLSFIFFQTYSGKLALLPLIAAVVSGLAVAANNIVAKQLPYNTTQTTLALWITSILANIPMIFILREPTPDFGLYIEWLYLILFSIFSILASWTLLKGLKSIDAGPAGILGLSEIVFGIIFGIVFFGEDLYLLTFIGACIILFASVFPYIYRKRTRDNISRIDQ